MKIYTKKGDAGSTGLWGGGSYPKDDLRVTAYGAVDELNSAVGIVVCDAWVPERDRLLEIQRQLFVLGSELACLQPTPETVAGFLQEKHVSALEADIDVWETELTPLKHFVLPGGSSAAAHLHLARTLCRRAEREAVALSHRDALRAEVLRYLNRLSDWLFVLSRLANHRAGLPDVVWEGLN